VSADVPAPQGEHLVSVVIPVYRGERHLSAVVADLAPFTATMTTPGGATYRVAEVLMVNDCGPDDSARVMRELEEQHPFARSIWLSRNFGQHAATLAGMASAGGDWIVTLDEDGQHDPVFIATMLDVALQQQASVVYASPTNTPPHSALRNVTSRGAKRVVKALSGGADASVFHSYRLILGEVGRSVAAYAGSGVYLDIALGWVAGRVTTAPVELRDEGERDSGYSLRSLLSHFWRMVLTGGTRGLRLVSILGVIFALIGFLIAVFLVYRQITHPAPVQGWTSLTVVVLICTGAVLFSLGVIAEYVGVAVNMAMGKPLYLITQDPADGPLGRRPH
jgi:undecaprenyl-phosphate 4-deoxy-4-formamido-L-arabinose transferase